LLFLSARNKRSSIFLKLHTQTLKEKTSNKSTIQTLENRNRALFPYPNATVAATTLTRKPKKQKQSSSILSSTEKTTFRDPSQFPFDTQFQKPAGKAQILQLHSTNHFRFSDKKFMREKITIALVTLHVTLQQTSCNSRWFPSSEDVLSVTHPSYSVRNSTI
jgi:hypothetical protein